MRLGQRTPRTLGQHAAAGLDRHRTSPSMEPRPAVDGKPWKSVGATLHDESMSEGKRWAGLLRAVNVGGRTLKSAALKKSALDAGFTDVTTLLASGNVVFTATGTE
ncbi:MAG: DUF1697 domain-containing protein, partial [Propionibacteriaceae bacterium]|nr:DUF1697 domain-containing protein [Propionibacteriaceae bacterium]